ncbi:universal stress protein [Pseudomonas guariconensis]|uniref:universal stress protein n=1 Tax=Pseudomonas TaxID=286 RepID=UPI001CE4A498|nr:MULTISPECIES: universal stress protein [Pseudomonas]MCO7634853.1 universal stress protein [Pseudomonas guariconensis]
MSDQQRLMLVVSPLMRRTSAYDRAVALAKAKGMALHIVAFDYLEGLATAGLVNPQALAALRQGYVEQHRQWLESQAAPMRRNGLTVTTEVVWVEDALEEILVHLREHPFAMLIKDIEHESRLMRALFTPLDIQLLRECKVPMHFVGQSLHALPQRVLAAVDLSRPAQQYEGFNERIVGEAAKLAMQCGAQLDLLYAYDLGALYDEADDSGRRSFLFSSNLSETLYTAQREAFDELAERNGIALENRHMITGDPAKVLGQFVENHGIDIVLMGRTHHRGLAKYIGSTVERVLYKLPGSVLVITPDAADG